MLFGYCLQISFIDSTIFRDIEGHRIQLSRVLNLFLLLSPLTVYDTNAIVDIFALGHIVQSAASQFDNLTCRLGVGQEYDPQS